MILLVPFVAFGLGAIASFTLRSRPAANTVGPAFAILGALTQLIVATLGFAGTAPRLEHAWQAPLGAFLLTADPLSAWFLVPVAGLGAAAAVYGHGYWRGAPSGIGWSAFNVVLAGMTGVLLARNAVLFLMAWEAMSLAAWVLVSLDHDQPDVRRAGWVYLVATHVGVSALLVLFLLLRAASGSADFTAALTAAPDGVLVALALVGFGAKAGLLPLHVWLPEAHAAAPSHVSALMSGALVKMGIYGLLRVLVVVAAPTWLPPLLVTLGLAGAFVGITAALGQRDIKRTLAYSTVENVGIILLGIGVGLWGRAHDNTLVAGLGLGGALLHVWNHAAMKGLLFFAAGSVVHGAGTRDIEVLGGLMRKMPWTGLAFVVGATAVSGLPPLAGFTGEWSIFLGLIEGGRADGTGGVGLMLAVGGLSLVGTLAAATFARLVGLALLGEPRTTRTVHEAPASMRAAMGMAALACVGLGLSAPLALRVGAGAIAAIAPLATLPDLRGVTGMNAALWLVIGVVAVALRQRMRARPIARSETWGCGYTAPTARMQYTGRSFAHTVEDALVPGPLRPVEQVAVPTEPLAAKSRLEVRYVDPLLDGFFRLARRLAMPLARVRRLQQGNTWLYVGYVAGILVIGLAWSVLRGDA